MFLSCSSPQHLPRGRDNFPGNWRLPQLKYTLILLKLFPNCSSVPAFCCILAHSIFRWSQDTKIDFLNQEIIINNVGHKVRIISFYIHPLARFSTKQAPTEIKWEITEDGPVSNSLTLIKDKADKRRDIWTNVTPIYHNKI